MASTKSWRSFFAASSAAVFVVGASRLLRYANPAWERATGAEWAKTRGLRLSAFRSATALGQALMPPAEVWAGATTHARRPTPGNASGPPWWDITFVPLPAAAGGLLGVIGFLTVTGERPARRAAGKVPAAVGEAQAANGRHYTFDFLGGTSEVSERFVNVVRLAASTAVPVWLVGEPGSGKAATARVIHHQGTTRDKPFVALDCRGVQPYLLDAMLFGKAGVMTHGLGTLFVNDPGRLPRDFQQKLADALGKPGAPRAVCAAELPGHLDARLVPGFATRFGVLEVRVPPLRDRLEDLPWLAERVTPHLVADATWPVLSAYDWPGNLRELADVLRGAATKAGAAPVCPDHLPRTLRERHLTANPLTPPRTMALAAVLEAVERRMIADALAVAGGNVSAAAKRLDTPRATLLRRIDALKLGASP